MNIEKVQIEVEGFPGINGPPIQMSGAKYERTRPVRKPTGSHAQRRGLEQARIRAGHPPFAFARARAFWHARDSAKDRAKGASKNVGRFPARKMDGLPRKE
jgi:hypothetical protein